MTASLTVANFPEVFAAFNGQPPFPWQDRLVREVAERRRWPDLFDLPTGSGKTAILDAAVFLLAVDAQQQVQQRWCPRRIAFVVDRRIVVDQAYERAERIRNALDTGSGTTRVVASALLSLTGGTGTPLQTTRLRGGVILDESWVRRPDQPLVITSTVDQVGSRLLFQGYGVSRGMRPIHAGLLSSDTLVVLDEVHLSQPFAQTMRALRHHIDRPGQHGPPSRWHLTQLSATPGALHTTATQTEDRWVFHVEPDVDLDGSESAGLLEQRIRAAKPARLQPVRTSRRDPARARTELAAAAATVASELTAHDQVNAVAVVVNRVDTARAVFDRLADSPVDRVLLTGRMRPLERDQLVAVLSERVRSGRDRPPRDQDGGQRPLVVAATQCIEAGADYDFDALVTECASIDALRQRFGRLDRFGELAAAGSPAPAVILGPADAVAPDAHDLVYGGSLAQTWQWLVTQSSGRPVDFAITALAVPDDPALLPDRPDAPHLLPGFLDAWCESPLSLGDDRRPPIDPWLHGTGEDTADVGVVWRSDLTDGLLWTASNANSDDTTRAAALSDVRDILAVCRPLAIETLGLPLPAVRRWLAEAEPMPVSDTEGMASPSDQPLPQRSRPFVAWNGDQTTVETRASALRPGATIVVPCDYGGLAAGQFGGITYRWWAPDARPQSPGTTPASLASAGSPTSTPATATDLGDEAHRLHSGRRVYRLVPPDGATTPWIDPHLQDVPTPAHRSPDETAEEHLTSWWSEHPEIVGDASDLMAATIRDMRATGSDGTERSWYVVVLPPSGSEAAMVPAASLPTTAADDVDSEPETSSFTGAHAELAAHLAGVATHARAIAHRCGLSDPLADDLALAATLHDVGKADERFQAWLRHGMPRPSDAPLLAKSLTAAFDRAERRAALQRSGYPPGARHEATSLALADGEPRLATMAHDWDLVRHLIVSHHGWGRPFLPPVDDRQPIDVVLDHPDGIRLHGRSDHALADVSSDVAERFWRLIDRYGWYGLARLEAILRLADHRRSEEEQRQHHNQRRPR